MKEKKHGEGIFAIKDSGAREEMSTGSKRDTQIGKPRPALIPPVTLVKLAMHFGNGADKYGPFNWAKGQPVSRYNESIMRHILAFRCGRTDEPHLISAIWNLICLDWTLDAIKAGILPEELDDRRPEEKDSNPMGEALYSMIAANVEHMAKDKNES